LNMAPLLGLGLGIDYSLFVVSRFREELRQRPVGEAVAMTVATAGRAVMFSGLTVLVGLLALIMFDFMFLRSLGVGGSLVVGISVLAALTLLPALLGVLGQRIDALPIRPLQRRLHHQGVWARLAAGVMAHPLRVLVPTLLLLLLLGSPFLHVRFSSPDASILPAAAPSRQGYELLRRGFSQAQLDPILVAVRTDGSVLAPQNLDRLYDFSRAIARDPRVARVESIVDLDPRITRDMYKLLYNQPGGLGDAYVTQTVARLARGNTTLMQVYSTAPPIAAESQDVVRLIRALGPAYGLDVLVDGGAAEVLDVVSRLYSEFPRAVALIVVTTYVVLFLLFRSVVLPLKAIVMNTLS
ncbi:MAG: MMPL family transporter, partial [Dactylosporangium sp.]|nr:MMPL family transporter [Dactylosporangium sp.]